MMTNRTVSLCVLAAFLAGCASAPQSRGLGAEAASKLQTARVVILAAPPITPVAQSNFAGDMVPLIPAPGLTPAQSVSPGGIIGGAIAVGLISALVGADAEAQRKESIQLLSRERNIPNQDFARFVAQREFTVLAAKQTPIRVLEVATVETPSGIQAASGKADASAAVMHVVVRQTMSVDLSRLRIHLRAKLVSQDGGELMDQNVFYLPISVAGVTKEDALRNWTEHEYSLYRAHVEKGVAGAVDALDATVLSRSTSPHPAPPATTPTAPRSWRCAASLPPWLTPTDAPEVVP